MSTLPPLWQVILIGMTPGRSSDCGLGERAISRGWPSVRAASDSLTTDGCVQLPPSQPWKAPAGVTSALSPTRAELGGSRRTTVARTKASPRRARSEASSSRSLRTRLTHRDPGLGPVVVVGDVHVVESLGGPGDDRCLVAMTPDHRLAASRAFGARELGEERAGVERRRRLDLPVLRNDERRLRVSM